MSSLASAQQKLTGLRDALPGATLVIDKTGEIRDVMVSDRTEKLLYKAPEQLVGQNLWSLFTDSKAETFHSAVQTVIRTNDVQTVEYELNVKAGTRHFRGTVSPLPNDDDDSTVLWFAQDITDQKEREQERQLVRELLDVATDAIFVAQPDTGAFRMVNQTAVDQLGYRRDELLKKHVWEITPRFDGPPGWQVFRQRNAGERFTSIDTEHIRADGTRMPVNLSFGHTEVADETYCVGIAREVHSSSNSPDVVYHLEPDETPSYGVLMAVSDDQNVSPTELPPLSRAINPDTLNQLFKQDPGNGPTAETSVSFTYHEYDVTVRAGDVVELTRSC